MTETPNTIAPDGQNHAGQLRQSLLASLQQNGSVTDSRIAEALATVPRHQFVPDATLQDAYANETVSIKDNTSGTSISCASQPSIVAMMLAQADLADGLRVLEIGAGSGYNAALLAHLTAPHGRVTTLDVDPDLVEHARSHLNDAGYDTVEVVCADGAAGHPDSAPYDRIIATVSPFDVPPVWLNQLTPTGRLVVPVRLAGDASRSIALTPADGYWRGVDTQMCTFMPLRHSSAADPRHVLDLTGDKSVTLQANQDQHIHAEAVHGIFDEHRSELWTGVTFGNNESFGDLWLWLALALENSVSRMPATPTAIEDGIVEPMLRWGSMATTARTGGRGLAYMTLRSIDMTLRSIDDRHELGVIGHGTHSEELAEHMAAEITRWNEHFRSHQVGVDLYPHNPPQPVPGRFVLARPSAHLTVTWRN